MFRTPTFLDHKNAQLSVEQLRIIKIKTPIKTIINDAFEEQRWGESTPTTPGTQFLSMCETELID